MMKVFYDGREDLIEKFIFRALRYILYAKQFTEIEPIIIKIIRDDHDVGHFRKKVVKTLSKLGVSVDVGKELLPQVANSRVINAVKDVLQRRHDFTDIIKVCDGQLKELPVDDPTVMSKEE